MVYWRKRSNGYYQICFKFKNQEGRWRTSCKSLRTKNKVLAKKKFDAMLNGEVAQRDCALVDWPDMFEKVLLTQGLDPKSIDKYLKNARSFVRFLSGQIWKLRDIKYEHIIDFTNHLIKAGSAPSTISGYQRSLRKMFGIAMNLELISKSPMAMIKIGRMEQRQLFFSEDDIRKILNATQGHDYDNALVLFFLQTGFRIQEVADSQWESINHEQRTIRIIGKFKKSRIQRIPWQTYEAIMKLPRDKPTIFGKQVKQIYKDIKDILRRAKVIGYPHAFRDSFATYSIKLMGVSTLRDRLGHSSIVQTDKYSHALNATIDSDILAYFKDWEF